MIRAAVLEEVAFADPATARPISTAYIDEPAMTPLVGDVDELAIPEEIESLASARRVAALPAPFSARPHTSSASAKRAFSWM